MFVRLAAVGLLASAIGCTGHRTTSQDPGSNTTPPQAGIELALTETGLQRGELVDAANFGWLPYLWVRVKVPGMVQTGMVTIRLINPRGEMLYSNPLPYSYDPSVKNVMGSTGQQIPVQLAKRVPGGYAIDAAVPVQGTHLQTEVTRGVWEVQADVEGYPQTLYRSLDVSHSRY
jgi:hypothetical protein